jgi:hypothetical protein
VTLWGTGIPLQVFRKRRGAQSRKKAGNEPWQAVSVIGKIADSPPGDFDFRRSSGWAERMRYSLFI